ncbi:g2102 [Coccomyxa elongata]
MEAESTCGEPSSARNAATSSAQPARQGNASGPASHALSLEDSCMLLDESPPPNRTSNLAPSGVRSQGAFWPGQQNSMSNLSLCTKFSSGSGGGLDRAIDAARASEEIGDEEDSEKVEDVRFLRSGISIDSAEGRSLRSYAVATPFAAPQIQSFSTPNGAASAGVLLHGLFQGSESLSLDEQDLYKHLVTELQSDGTLSSDISDLLTELQMSSSNASECPSEELIEAQREKVEEVVQRLRSKLPADKAAQLSSFDSYGLLDLYNHHHTNQDASRLGPTPASGHY